MIRAGFPPRQRTTNGGFHLGYWRAAKLITPIFQFPFTWRSVLEYDQFDVQRAFLCTADLLSYEDVFFTQELVITQSFPYGFNVIPDDVPL